jgi:hypothetical protein
VTFEEVRPRYRDASLADVLPSALAVLGAPGAPDPLDLRGALDGVRRVAVLLIDGLGWHLLGPAAPFAPTLAEFAAGRLGSARMITSGFPSTTPVSLATLGTGSAPGAHGVLGLTVNVPGTDRVLNHLRWLSDPDPVEWQPLPTAFDRAAAAGVRTAVVSSAEHQGSGLCVAAYRGADYRGASEIDEVADAVLGAFASHDLVYGYHPTLDTMGHVFGVDSEPWRAAAADVDRLITQVADRLPADTALLVTADHGQLDVPPEARIDIDADPRLRTGVRVVAGEARVRYVHTVPGARDDVLAAWRTVLGPAAWVGTREEAVADGWFGPVPEAHLARVGDVVAICRERYALLATKTEPEFVSNMIAYHGANTALEMQIPLLVLRR